MLMKRLAFTFAAAMVAAAALAADVPAPKTDDHIDKIVRDALPVCAAEAKITQTKVEHKLPSNLTASYIQVESTKQSGCDGQYISVVSKAGDVFLGIPWFLDNFEGATLEEKLKNFGWNALHETFAASIDRNNPTREGLYRVTIAQTTERGLLPLEGEMDPNGMFFFLGHFHPIADDIRTVRLKAFEPFIASAPAEGAAKPAVTVIEFSDFECPSCQHAAGYLSPILEKHGDQVRYIRFDLPLITSHPWAFSAAVAGRAVYRQKPELFWEYKKQVYANQDKLTAFTLDDFARGFAQDHDLDLKKYDADIADDSLKNEILKGVGAAYSNDIRSTPSYIVNGMIVDPGKDGSALESYVAELLKK
jgi:protein-disulfide isomerase